MRGVRIIEARRGRELRAAQTSAEDRLWAKLRARRLGGFKFVRQAPVGPYFADFLCRDEKLIVETDGVTHSSESERGHDAARDTFLATQGYRVLRFWNAEIFDGIENVLETILAALEKRETL